MLYVERTQCDKEGTEAAGGWNTQQKMAKVKNERCDEERREGGKGCGGRNGQDIVMEDDWNDQS